MSEELEHCQVCGRTREDLEEINQEPEFRTHQGITKCVKCIQEYEIQINGNSDMGREPAEPGMENGDEDEVFQKDEIAV